MSRVTWQHSKSRHSALSLTLSQRPLFINLSLNPIQYQSPQTQQSVSRSVLWVLSSVSLASLPATSLYEQWPLIMVQTPLPPCIVVVHIADRISPRKRSQKSISFRTGTSRSARTHTLHDTPSIQWEAKSLYGVSHDIQAFNNGYRDGVRRGGEGSVFDIYFGIFDTQP
jgi:hypothetical protein